jgi:hypothetical protein
MKNEYGLIPMGIYSVGGRRKEEGGILKVIPPEEVPKLTSRQDYY